MSRSRAVNDLLLVLDDAMGVPVSPRGRSYRRLQCALMAAASVLAGAACLTDSGAAYLGLPAGRYDPWRRTRG